ncbi:hypothetical protein [Nonomuraea pusilla]|uniref:Secreted protein n=1 Tax=Nonomuraea pusilla TaxID=46177 RepID=A0A1H8CHL5_9ACTN|nr:hypothetical protein [Nonomuraea pusilla]SEM94593.1 hypothetical protein SAMN05660976_06423 [Nonomuraea pusilla]
MSTHVIVRTGFAAALAGGLLLGGLAPAAQAATATTAGSFGPYGYGGVRLGMSAKTAKATGKVVAKGGSAPSPTCTAWDLKAHPTGRDSVGLFISKKHGVAVIFAPKGARTPQGIGLGSTKQQLKRAYPNLKTAASGYPYVTVPGNPKAYFSFLLNAKGTIYEMALGLPQQDCVN